MSDIVIEYDRIVSGSLTRSVRSLEQEGYQIWLKLPEGVDLPLVTALEQHVERKGGVYSVRADTALDAQDVDSVLDQFAEQSGQAGCVDTEAVTLLACRGSHPSLPALFRRIRAEDLIDLSGSVEHVPTQPLATPLSQDTTPPKRGLLFEKVMRANGFAASQADRPADLAFRMPRQNGMPTMPALHPDGSALEPVHNGVPADAPATPPLGAREPFVPTYSYAKPERPYTAPVHSGASLPKKAETAQNRSMLVSTLHALSGLMLVVTVVTFIAAAFIFAGQDMRPINVGAIAMLFALAPLTAYLILRTVEHRLRAKRKPTHNGADVLPA